MTLAHTTSESALSVLLLVDLGFDSGGVCMRNLARRVTMAIGRFIWMQSAPKWCMVKTSNVKDILGQ